MSHTSWQFTLNNWTEEQVSILLAIKCRYLGFGKEVAPTTGTPHLQGMVMWPSGKTHSASMTALSVGKVIFIEPAIDSFALYEYNKKGGDYYEQGKPPVSKKRQGDMGKEYWDAVLVSAKAGRFEEIDSKLQVTHCKNLDYIRNKELVTRELPAYQEMDNYWYWGESGTGKSRKAREENPLAYLKMCNKWWDGYEDQDVMLLEDFDRAHSILCHHVKLWADHYPFTAEVKQASRKIRFKKLIVTSNFHPSEIWTDSKDLEPILRRFKVIEFKKLKEHST